MKNGTLIGAACGALVVGALWTGVSALTQDGMEEASPEAAPEMTAWIEANAPGEQHKLIARLAGDWNAVAEFQMAPDAPPMVSQATQVSTMEFDGRYLKSVYESDFMGDPFTGISFMGYDNAKKTYNSFWIDSMSTSMFLSAGTCNDAGNEWTLFGEMTDPSGETVEAKHVITISDDNHYTMTMYRSTPDGMIKEGTITYTRSN